jgi:hypothetical protein
MGTGKESVSHNFASVVHLSELFRSCRKNTRRNVVHHHLSRMTGHVMQLEEYERMAVILLTPMGVCAHLEA